MSYYLEVSAFDMLPSSTIGSGPIALRHEVLDKEDEIKLYHFLKCIYSMFPRPDDMSSQEDDSDSIWANDIQIDHGTLTLVLAYSGVEIGAPAICKAAEKYGLRVLDPQTGIVIRRRPILLAGNDLSSYAAAHIFLLEMADWSKFCKELDLRAGDKDMKEWLATLAEGGYGPAKRALSFMCYMDYCNSCDKEVRRLNIVRAHELINEVGHTAYACKGLVEMYSQAAMHEGVTLVV
ncbi:MAG: hypothetical protein WCT03_21625 [Candidatus Obscuribacterales bacterium]|jgi:hypothetical protein